MSTDSSDWLSVSYIEYINSAIFTRWYHHVFTLCRHTCARSAFTNLVMMDPLPLLYRHQGLKTIHETQIWIKMPSFDSLNLKPLLQLNFPWHLYKLYIYSKHVYLEIKNQENIILTTWLNDRNLSFVCFIHATTANDLRLPRISIPDFIHQFFVLS